MRHLPRSLRSVIRCTLVLIAISIASAAVADVYPVRPIKFIVPWPAGGMVDTRIRRLAASLARNVGQPVIVENRPGASGVLGMSVLAKAPKDGYTIGFGSINDLAIAQVMGLSLTYDADRDLQPITQLYASTYLLVAGARTSIRTVDGLRAAGQSSPTEIRFGTFGAASTSHIAGVLLEKWLGVSMVFVHFKGGAPLLTSLASGEIDIALDFATTSMPLIDAGKLRPLMVTGDRRLAMLPDVPSAAEAKVPLIDIHGWGGVLAPAGTPRAIVDRLNVEFGRILRDPQAVVDLAAGGLETRPGTPEEFAMLISMERAKWGRLVEQTGVKPE